MWRPILLIVSLYVFGVAGAASAQDPLFPPAEAPHSKPFPTRTEWNAESESASPPPVCEDGLSGEYQPRGVDQVLQEPPAYPTLPRPTGFFHLDAVTVGQDSANRATVGDVQDGVDFRRARLAAVGDISEDINYILEFDFAASQARFVDAFVDIAQVPALGNVRIGRWRQPFGMSPLTGIRALPFLERPTSFAFVPFRQTGIGTYGTDIDEQLTWAVSAYRYPTFGFGNNVGDNGGWGLAGRITMLPFSEDEGDRLLHLGLDYSFNDPSNDQLRFQNTPEIFVGENAGAPGTSPIIPPFVDTGVVPTRNVSLYGLEAAAASGAVSVQSEVYGATVKMPDGNSETLPGAYAHVRWILTGERLPYDKAVGIFGRIVPRQSIGEGGIGAWELAARWSYINLDGTDFLGPGRQLNDATLGLNWYLNKNLKFQVNYIHAFLKDKDLGRSDADFFALRTQVDF